MLYDLSMLDHVGGTARHVWVGDASSNSREWIATVRFAPGMKPHDQVAEQLARTLGPERVRELKIAVGTDVMWQRYNCYSQPPHLLVE